MGENKDIDLKQRTKTLEQKLLTSLIKREIEKYLSDKNDDNLKQK